MIKKIENGFYLSNQKSSLVLMIEPVSQKPICVHFGAYIADPVDAATLYRKPTASGNSTVYDEAKSPILSLDNLPLELSTPFKGDYGDPSLLIEGPRTMIYDFVYESYEIGEGKPLEGLPTPRDVEEELTIHLTEPKMGVKAELHYLVFKNSEVFGRYLKIFNESEEEITLRKAASMQLVLEAGDYELVSFYGGWADEFKENVSPITYVRQIVDVHSGTSSARHNPFFYIRERGAGLNHGKHFGINLVYSGNHFFEVELENDNLLKIQNGISSFAFKEVLKTGESFETPVAVLSFSEAGLNGLTENFHFFVNSHIVPERFEQVDKLIDYNSWEGCGAKFDEGEIKSLMRKASGLGMELFVLDDGWFGKRDDDSTSLGDWFTNKKKLPHGIKGLSSYAHKLGMKFGLWFEPEMISPKSELYKSHPDWALTDGIHEPVLGRHQLVLDLSKDEVVDYLFEAVGKYLRDEGVDFVKWDWNRCIADIPNSPSNYIHHYYLGLYKLMDRLTKAYPNVLFQNCASGGNRCDLGMLSYFPLTWVSDDTDGYQRALIQEGMIVGYPQSVMANHVSCKTSAQLLRKTSFASKFEVASLGVMGYELNLNDCSKQDMDEIGKQVALYKKYRHAFQYGKYIQHHKLTQENTSVRQVGDKDFTAVVRTMTVQKVTSPLETLEVKGLDPEAEYSFTLRKFKHDIRRFGGMVNYVSPIHLKEESNMLNIVSHFVQMDCEKCEGKAKGSILNAGAIKLPKQWQGTGFDQDVALYGDFHSRMYLIEKIK
ncbi:MAG: alpha-galactosidase [Bacillota bacterium]|nr:alpha-galactosidase [Bacillota bacterium]